MNETLDILKGIAIRQDTNSHALRLLSFNPGGGTWLELWKLRLAESGLVWVVTVNDMLRFKYHVNIRGTAIQDHSGQYECYLGDIPDFAIERGELALQVGIKYITLHSMNPLPVIRIPIDPVMVGWLQDPVIFKTCNKIYTNRPTYQGVVLAVWNNEKELEL